MANSQVVARAKRLPVEDKRPKPAIEVDVSSIFDRTRPSHLSGNPPSSNGGNGTVNNGAGSSKRITRELKKYNGGRRLRWSGLELKSRKPGRFGGWMIPAYWQNVIDSAGSLAT